MYPKKTFHFLDNSRNFTIFLLLFLFTTCLVVYSPFLFTNNYYTFFDANDDTFHSYLPLYQLIVNKLRAGSFSFMDLSSGLGSNILDHQMMIFDPFAIFIYIGGFLAGASLVPSMLIWVQILRVLCAGLFCSFFLSEYKFSALPKFFSCLAYSFSAYMVGGIGQHYMFATAPVFIVLFFWLIDRSKKTKSTLIFLSVCTAILGIWSIYFCYMILLASAFYTIVRFFQSANKISFRNFLSWCVPILTAVIIGIMISGVILIPSGYQIIAISNRISDTSIQNWWAELLHPHSLVNLKTTFLRLFSEQSEGTMNAWQNGEWSSFNAPHLYFSPLFLVCLPQYVQYLFTNRKERRNTVSLIVLVLITLSFIFPIFGIVFNAFQGYQARYIFVLLPSFAYVIATSLSLASEKRIFYKKALGITLSIAFISLLLTNWDESNMLSLSLEINYLAIGAAILFFYLLSGTKPFKFSKLFKVISVMIIIGGTCNETITSLTLNRTIISSDDYDNGYDTKTADQIMQLNAINSDNFFRIENSILGWFHSSAFNNAMVHRYRGASYYNSVINSNLLAFRQTWGDGESLISGSYSNGAFGRPMDRMLADLLGIKYIFTNYKTTEQGWKLLSSYKEDKHGGNTENYCYVNQGITTAGLLFYEWYPESQLATMSPLEKQAILPFSVSLNENITSIPQSNQSLLKKISAIQETETTEWSSRLNSETFLLQPITTMGKTLTTNEMSNGLLLRLDTKEMMQPDRRSWLCFNVTSKDIGQLTAAIDIGWGCSPVYWANKTIALSPGQKEIIVPLPSDSKQINIVLQGTEEIELTNIQILSADGHNYTNSNVFLSNPSLSGLIEGSIQTEEPAILVIPIFYEPGWQAFIDDQPVNIMKANLGMCALEIPTGNHIIRLNYTTPCLHIGIVVSIFGFLAFIGLTIWILKHNLKFSKNKEITK